MLNEKYFECVSVRNGFVAYAPKNHPVILYSTVSGKPLVALGFVTEKAGVKTMTVPRRPLLAHPGRDAFQAMISEDECDVGFALTNLTSAYVNVNLMRTSRSVSEVDPGPEYGINQVNEIRPFTTYVVQTDQRNNRKIVVSALRRPTPSGAPIRVTMAEAELGAAPELFTFFPCVNPITTHPQLADFEGTEWRAAPDVLVLPQKEESVYLRASGTRSFLSHPDRRGTRLNSSLPDNDRDYGCTRGERSDRSGRTDREDTTLWNRSVTDEERSQEFRGRRDYGRRTEEGVWSPPCGMPIGVPIVAPTYNGDTAAPPPRGVKKMAASANASSSSRSKSGGQSTARSARVQASRRESSTSMEDSEDGGGETIPDRWMKLGESRGVPKGGRMEESGGVLPREDHSSVVDSSFAGTMKYGAVMRETTVETGNEYDYGKASVPCVVAVSVTLEIAGIESRRYPSTEDVDAALAEAKTAAYRPKVVYQEDTCCVCMDEGSATSASPNAVICTCGHACVHASCGKALTKCPLCRQSIAILLPTSALV